MSNDAVIGIDFGTSNSFCCSMQKKWLRTRSPEAITIADQQDTSFPTALLYELDGNGTKNLIAFGNVAQQEWYQIPPEEASRYQYVCNFKPDIAHSETSREHAVTFLRALSGALFDPQTLHGAPITLDCKTAFGVPASSPTGHKTWTKSVAKEAGFSRAVTFEEPKGALAYHLHSGDIKLNDLRAGVLVVDFGGGTCDFAYLVRGECQHFWGKPLYGGRLFDDLFFQWLCEENPGAEAAMHDTHDEPFVHWVCCRKAKETFSFGMARDRDRPFTYADFRGHGAIRRVTWSEFRERASTYRPTERLRKDLESSGKKFGEGPMDLVQLFEASLIDGLKRRKIGVGEIDYVILTGGSSLWPFVTDVLTDGLQLSPERIFRAQNPQVTVGMGVGLLPLLQQESRDKKKLIERDGDLHVDQLMETVNSHTENFIDDIAEEIADTLADDWIEPLAESFRESKDTWSISDFREAVEQTCHEFEPFLEELVEQRQEGFGGLLEQEIAHQISNQLGEYQVRWAAPSKNRNIACDSTIENVDVSAFSEHLTNAISAVVGIALSVVTAELAGGAGIALILTGPIGWAIGLIVGLALAACIVIWGRKYAKAQIESIAIPAWKWARRIVLPKNLRDRIRRQTRADISEKLRGSLEDHTDEMRERIDELYRQVTDELNWVNLL